jgi:hypothetical protein
MPIGLTLPQYDSSCGWIDGSPYTSEVEASRIRAPVRFASPSMLIEPCTHVLVVWTGSRW